MTENKDYRNGYVDGFLDGIKVAAKLLEYKYKDDPGEQVTVTCDDNGPKTYSGGN